MQQHDIDVSFERKCVVVTATDKADQTHTFLFDGTANGLVFISEIIDLKDDSVGIDGRHYVAEENMTVPPAVEEVLAEKGFETIVDTNGKDVV